MTALITALAILAAYVIGRVHQQRVEWRHWVQYWAYLRDQRERATARFGRLRVVE